MVPPLAGSAAICNRPLFELLSYNADTEVGMEILEGTFKPPTGTDPAIVIVLNKIARIWRLMEDRSQHQHKQRRFSALLEKDERTHSIIVLRTSLWSLRSRGSLRPFLRGAHLTPSTHH